MVSLPSSISSSGLTVKVNCPTASVDYQANSIRLGFSQSSEILPLRLTTNDGSLYTLNVVTDFDGKASKNAILYLLIGLLVGAALATVVQIVYRYCQ